MDAIELWTRQRLELNLSRYARIVWSSTLGITANAEYQYTLGKSTIWIRATRRIRAGEIIWVRPPSTMRFGMSPVTMYWNPPCPSGYRACQYPEYWDYITVECLPDDPNLYVNSELRLSVTCDSISDCFDARIVVSELYSSILRSDALCSDISEFFMIQIWFRLYDYLKLYALDIGKLIPRFLKFMLQLLELLEMLGMWCCCVCQNHGVSCNGLYQWSFGSVFGVGFASDNAGDGPKRLFSQSGGPMPQCKLRECDWDMRLRCDDVNEATAEIRIACWNSNGHLVSDDASTLTELVLQLQLDILMVSDSRLTQRAANYHFKSMKRVLKGYSMIGLHTSRSSYSKGGGARMNTMGGTAFIISPRCAQNLIDTGDDGSGLGIAGYVLANIGGVKYCFISVYQPIGGDDAGASTVLARLQAFLHRRRISDNPRAYVLNIVSRWVSRFTQKGFRIVVGGDFNANPAVASGAKLRMWMEENRLVNTFARFAPAQYFTHMKRGVGVSCIDHLFTDQCVLASVLRARVIQLPQLTALSDHCVLFMVLMWPDGIPHSSPLEGLTPPKRVELRHYDSDAMDAYQQAMQQWVTRENLSQQSASSGLAKIMQQSVSVTYELGRPTQQLSQRIGFRSQFKDGYSPCFIALKSAYLLVLHYHQQLVRSHGSTQQQRYHLHCSFIRQSHKWLSKFPFADFVHDDVIARVHNSAYTALCNIRLLEHVTIEDLYTRALGIRQLMHGRLRAEYRRRMSGKIQAMEEMRQQHRLGRMFQMVNLNEKQQVDLSAITTAGQVITDPVDVQIKLSAHFAEWYSIPRNLHPVARQIYDGHLWSSILEGVFPTANGSESFQVQAFYQACQYKVPLSLRERFRDVLMVPISEQEYSTEVCKMKYGKAPGPSGATATMIKAWPAEIHSHVLRWINEIWISRSAPQWWHLGHLRPIPKTGEMTLDNLRPLGLYEISRKILTAILIRRIYNLWEAHELLDDNQHAFRRRRSTAQAILRLLNPVEDAVERGVPLRLIQWDLRRAFDSVSYNFIRMALLRLGVPVELVDFLVTMMENNVMTVASPLHMSHHATSSDSCCNDMTFHQERGTGQGDPPSPFIWIAVFDILLTMLRTVPAHGAMYAHGPVSRVYTVQDIAYADDLVTIASSQAHQQAKADMVCTFCACKGMQIALPKVTSFAFNCDKSSSNVVLHDTNWSAHVLAPTMGAQAYKYLGFITDHINGDQNAYDVTLSYVRAASSHLIHCHASREVKLLVYRMQILPKILYTATKACWSLKQVRQLDRYAAAILKHVGRHLATSANSMMFFPTSMCGSGLHPISDLAQAQKWGDLTRALDLPGETAWAAHGLIERAMRQTAQQAPSTQFRTVASRNTDYLKGFVGSLIEWGGEVGYLLANTPTYNYHESNSPILPYLEDGPETEILIRQLQRQDITVQGELVRRSHTGEPRWAADAVTMLTRRLVRHHQMVAPSDVGIIFNCGQMYALPDQIVEILGVLMDSNDILCYKWLAVPGSSNMIMRSALHGTSLVVLDYTDFCIPTLQRLITCPARTVSNMIRRRIVSSTLCAEPTLGHPRSFTLPSYVCEFINQLTNQLQQQELPYVLFTDGSHATSDMVLSNIISTDSHQHYLARSAAAVIAIADSADWQQYPCFVLYLNSGDEVLPGITACYTELLALIVAVHVQNYLPDMAIYSDCLSAIKILEVAARGGKRAGLCKIRPLLSTLCELQSPPRVFWTKGHPERHKQQHEWTFTDWGIFLADLAASNKLAELQNYVPIVGSSALLTQVASDFILPGQWFWTSGTTTVPAARTPIQQQAFQRVSCYLAGRDQYRIDRGDPPFWEDTSLGLAHKCWRSITHGALGCNIVLKNVLDKYWHGRNRAKGLAPPEAELVASCQHCGMLDSQKHIFLECPLNDLCDLRLRARDELARVAASVATELAPTDTFEHGVLLFITEHAFNIHSPDVTRLWLGSWTTALLFRALRYGSTDVHLPVTIPYERARGIQQVIVRLTTCLVRTVADMMRVRCSFSSSLSNSSSTKRQRRHDTAYEQVVAQSAFPPPKLTRVRRNTRSIKVREEKRQRVVQKKRMVVQDDDAGQESVPMDIVGYVSHPWGATQSCDYDKD